MKILPMWCTSCLKNWKWSKLWSILYGWIMRIVIFNASASVCSSMLSRTQNRDLLLYIINPNNCLICFLSKIISSHSRYFHCFFILYLHHECKTIWYSVTSPSFNFSITSRWELIHPKQAHPRIILFFFAKMLPLVAHFSDLVPFLLESIFLQYCFSFLIWFFESTSRSPDERKNWKFRLSVCSQYQGVLSMLNCDFVHL